MICIKILLTTLICSSLLLSGCIKPAVSGAVQAATVAVKPAGIPVRPKNLLFTQDGLHNCGTIAMLISWAKSRPQDAAKLVRKQPNGNYQVLFHGISPVGVSAKDLAAASKARILKPDNTNNWAKVVLTAFVKVKCGSGPLDFRSIEWIYAGEIGSYLTGTEAEVYNIKEESQDTEGRITLGKPVSIAELERIMTAISGKPAVAYSNRRIHIWAVLAYDRKRALILVRNPRRKNSQWLTITEFRRKFQAIVYEP